MTSTICADNDGKMLSSVNTSLRKMLCLFHVMGLRRRKCLN